jgi:hypothetical protein
MNCFRKYIVLSLLLTLQIIVSYAQDLEPRSLSPIPTGGNFIVASYGRSSGNILLDNSAPIADLNSTMDNIVVAYARSFKLFNKLSKFDIIAPYSFATFNATVAGTDSSTSRNGFGDPLVRLSIVLIGVPPLTMSEFIKTSPQKFNLGVSLRVRPPLGQYNSDKLINLGTNRWSTKISVGASYSFTKKINAELYLNTWFFTKNNNFFNGNIVEQKPLLSTQVHLSYIFKPGVWLAISVGQSFFGETILNNVEQNDFQRSSRLGGVFAYKLNNHNALKIGITSGLSTRYGADFTTVLIAYQFIWFDK